MLQERQAPAKNIVHRVNRGILWFKLAAWTLFALTGPILFTAMHNYLGVFITGLISAAIGYFAFGPRSVDFRGSNYLRNILIAQGAFFALYGGRVLFSPAAPWEHVRGGTRASLAIRPDGGVYGVEFTEHNAGFFRLDPDARTWSRESFPGKFVTDIFLSPDAKQIIAPEDRSRRVWIYDAGSWKMRTEKRRLKRTDVECANFSPTPFVPEMCAQNTGGAKWIAAAGLLSGRLAVKDTHGDYAEIKIPGPRVEALFLNPENKMEAWLAFWGSGVYRTRDRGATWQLMGLKGSEVTALVVDFRRKVAYASTGSGIYMLRFE